MPLTSAPEVTDSPARDINTRSVHSQRVYEDRPAPLCEVQRPGEVEMVPCNVTSQRGDANDDRRIVQQVRTKTSEASSPQMMDLRQVEDLSKSTRSTRENPRVTEDARIFQVGSAVEIRDAASAFPATVTGFRSNKEGGAYNIVSDLTRLPLNDVAAQRVHPYHAYEHGTAAWCDVSAHIKGDVHLLPCTVLSHVEVGGDHILYQVTVQYYSPKRDVVHERNTFLPQTRVQRLFKVTATGGVAH